VAFNLLAEGVVTFLRAPIVGDVFPPSVFVPQLDHQTAFVMDQPHTCSGGLIFTIVDIDLNDGCEPATRSADFNDLSPGQIN
jgi:hypothetical protein